MLNLRLHVMSGAYAICALIAQQASADDRRSDPAHLTIMTFNAEFLWDGEQPEEGQADFPWKGSSSEAREHMRKVAEVIVRSDPDIVNLVEVENLDALNLLNTQFLAGRGYRAYLAQGRDTYTGQDMGLLTRIDPEGATTHYDDRSGHSGNRTKSVSKNYIARFQIGPEKLALIGIHLLAQPNREDRRLDREAQADAVRSMAVQEAAAGYQTIVLGDFNDYDGDPEYLDNLGSTPITNVLATIRRMNAADANDDLINACKWVPSSQRYTAFWDQNDDNQIDPSRELTSIDHMLIAQTLTDNVDTVAFMHEHDPRTVSDHFPIVVRFRFGGSPTTQPIVGPATGVRIIELLPNPPGDESVNETATLKNFGSASADLTGWKLRDAAGKTWDLSGALGAGQTRTVQRNGQPMSLNNNGDTIHLLAANGTPVQVVSYGRCDEGEIVSVQP